MIRCEICILNFEGNAYASGFSSSFSYSTVLSKTYLQFVHEVNE